jgi:hypothetical protein
VQRPPFGVDQGEDVDHLVALEARIQLELTDADTAQEAPQLVPAPERLSVRVAVNRWPAVLQPDVDGLQAIRRRTDLDPPREAGNLGPERRHPEPERGKPVSGSIQRGRRLRCSADLRTTFQVWMGLHFRRLQAK